ncbi:RNA-guided endonuclease IscB [Streptosporangium lutulentum]|uniref:5-methylcytosine-specific restriction endonuclease McrA n=1 Tax=Streptosporangium lutulentum TaxID=1461250 RepID=A0ABT9QHC1_9ACTN|nr:RNA-guided endonuclease IscB [Streptosporangium lutulentum]MDP9846163.1 5-methylcytosine-specific restriction endonuclease McrA [Streptosporangium lutulentum]
MFVLDAYGQPLDPCHPARARRLLAAGRAVVARHTPFVIRLRDRAAANSTMQGAQVGIDPGSRHTGIAVFAERDANRTGLYSIQLDHRGGAIRDKLTVRSQYRRRRRSKNLRYRAPRFLNRTKPKGWLAPSLKHRVDTTMSWVSRLTRWAPITAVHVEKVAFDTHTLSAGRPLEGVEYQQGTLYGYEAREYLLAKWSRKCAYCGATDTPLNIDHIHPRSRGGSDRISNLCVACIGCNQAKNATSVEVFLADRPKVLARVLAQAKTPLRDAAAVNSTRWTLWWALTGTGLSVATSSGGRTKWNRSRTGAPKAHTLDALHVGDLDTVSAWPHTVLVVTATGRGTYARTRTDKYGFPRLALPRTKTIRGFQTGDLVRAIVPSGKKAGVHTGRVAIRSTGSFNIRTRNGLVQGIHHRHVGLLQRADGYGYATHPETRHCAAFPPGSEEPGFHTGGNR